MKDIRGMTADTEEYRSEIEKLIEADSKARQIYIEMKAELSAARQLHRRGGQVEKKGSSIKRPRDMFS